MTIRSTAAVLTVGLLLAACGGDDPEATPSATASTIVDPSGSPGDDTTATASPTASETATPTQAPTETPPDPTSSPTSQPNPNPEGATPEPIPTGTYSYATNGWSQLGNGPQEPMPSTTTLSAAAMSGGRQVVTRDLTDDEGYGQTIQRVMEYAKTGFFLHEVRTSAKVKVGLLGDVVDNRTFVASPAGALGTPESEVGWENTFTMTGDGVTLTVTAKLVRFEDVTVGGTTVRAAVVTQHVEFSGDLEGTSDSTSWFRPEDLLPLKERSSSEVTQAGSGVAQKSEYTATLKSLTPA
ncbi:MAG: hypothetical protein R3249_02195 [Nitriliruptorales bacterium]|nr:hypothetical protein [Nitriliruptorales bacterium]